MVILSHEELVAHACTLKLDHELTQYHVMIVTVRAKIVLICQCLYESGIYTL